MNDKRHQALEARLAACEEKLKIRQLDLTIHSAAHLEKFLTELGPRGTFGAGQDFLRGVLEMGDVHGLNDFMQRMERVIQIPRPINPDLDFTKAELDLYHRCKLGKNPGLSRRQMIRSLATTGGLVVGTLGVGMPVVGVGTAVADQITGKTNADGFDLSGKAVLGAVAATSGAVTVSRSLEQINRIRLQQVAEAISALAVHAGPRPGKYDSPLSHLNSRIQPRPGMLSRILMGSGAHEGAHKGK